MKLGIISSRALIRRALSVFLTSTGAALVVMEGSNLRECLDEVKRSQSEILIVDLCGRGLKDLPDLSRLGLALKVVVLLDDDDIDSESYARAFELGVWGCLTTRQSPAVLQGVISAVARGERWIPKAVADGVGSEVVAKDNLAVDAPRELTPREWEVLGLIANGFRNKEISSRLTICEETAKSHVKSIYRKLKIKRRSEAMVRYFDYVHRRVDEDPNQLGRSSSPGTGNH